MYTILLNDDNKLTTSVRERIMQRSKLVDNLHFLVEPVYKNTHNMAEFAATMEYLSPVSKEYRTESLVLSDELYKGKLEYKVPFDTALTKEAGNVEVQLSFIKVDLDADGKSIQYVRKTSKTIITIAPITAWSDIIPDSALTALDQRMAVAESMIHAANEMNQYLYETQVDNIKYDQDENSLQLLSGLGVTISYLVQLLSLSDSLRPHGLQHTRLPCL